MQLLLALPLASAFMVSPLAPSHAALAMRAAQPAKMSLVSGIKDSILPKNADQTAANVVGLQMVGWGAGAIVVPNLMMQTIFATTLTGAPVLVMRGARAAGSWPIARRPSPRGRPIATLHPHLTLALALTRRVRPHDARHGPWYALRWRP